MRRGNLGKSGDRTASSDFGMREEAMTFMMKALVYGAANGCFDIFSRDRDELQKHINSTNVVSANSAYSKVPNLEEQMVMIKNIVKSAKEIPPDVKDAFKKLQELVSDDPKSVSYLKAKPNEAKISILVRENKLLSRIAHNGSKNAAEEEMLNSAKKEYLDLQKTIAKDQAESGKIQGKISMEQEKIRSIAAKAASKRRQFTNGEQDKHYDVSSKRYTLEEGLHQLHEKISRNQENADGIITKLKNDNGRLLTQPAPIYGAMPTQIPWTEGNYGQIAPAPAAAGAAPVTNVDHSQLRDGEYGRLSLISQGSNDPVSLESSYDQLSITPPGTYSEVLPARQSVDRIYTRPVTPPGTVQSGSTGPTPASDQHYRALPVTPATPAEVEAKRREAESIRQAAINPHHASGADPELAAKLARRRQEIEGENVTKNPPPKPPRPPRT